MNRVIILISAFFIEFPFGVNNSQNINIAYYELAPYIYRNENGSMSGIFPELFAEISYLCQVNFEYNFNAMTANNFSTIMKKKVIIDQYMYGDLLWLPLTQDISIETSNTELTFISSDILTTGVDVIVHRDHVGPLAKIRIGIFECRYLFLIGLTLSIIFGALIWFFERWNNLEFSKTSHGILTGLWFG